MNKLRALVGLCLCVVGTGAFSRAAEAQSRDVQTSYQQLIEEGVRELNLGNHAEARALFLRAHALTPNARTLRALGVAEFELKNYVDCIARLEEALRSNSKPLVGAMRVETEDLLVRARAYVGRVVIDIAPGPLTDVRVLIDQVPVERDANHTVNVTVGEHVLHIQAHGFEEERRSLSVKSSELERVQVTLRPTRQLRPESASVPRTPSAPVEAVQQNNPRPQQSVWTSPWLWGGVGVLVVGGAVAGVLLATQGSGHAQTSVGSEVGGTVYVLTKGP